MIEYLKQYNEFMTLICLVMGLVNMCLAALLLSKKINIEKRTDEIAKNLVADLGAKTTVGGRFTIRSEQGVIDGGVIFALAGLAIGAIIFIGVIIFNEERVSKNAVKNKNAIVIENSIYRCAPIYEYRPAKFHPPIKKECK